MDNKILEGNKKAWNEALTYHKKARNGSLHKKFKDPNFVVYDAKYDASLLKRINEMNFKGKKVAHIQTNNGRELISLMRLSGAEQGVGFDISDEAVKEAIELAKIAKVNVNFECVNVFDINKKYNNYFDVIYITEGSLSWLSDMDTYFSVMSRIIKKDGIIFINEIHPVGFVFDENCDKKVNYDDKGPYKMRSSLDYVGGKEYEPKDCYWFMHKMSDIIMALIHNGFQIKEFDESTTDTGWIDPDDKNPNFPRNFTLICEKTNFS